jgi:YD repeat-containing protein
MYDQWGNAPKIYVSNGRCTAITYDDIYQQWPSTVTTFSGGCDNGPLKTTYKFDRGYGQITSILSQVGRLWIRGYDDFGRLALGAEPNSSMLGGTTTTLLVGYSDDAPIRRVHYQMLDGDEANPTFVHHYRYYDGLGDMVENLDPAGSTGLSDQWLVSGMHSRYPTGRVAKTVKPFFVPASSLDPTSVPRGSLPVPTATGAARAFTYDGLGRPTSSSDSAGNVSRFVYDTINLAVTIRDAEQSAGTHTGAYSTAVHDGHGRNISMMQHLAQVPQPGDLTTSVVYQATGEPRIVTQSFSAGGSVSRSMQYDSLGRLVKNVEPNVGVWTYAYNDSGELVGTSDARGCGKNVIHDGMGRVVAEDYSPCQTDQAAYSPPDLGTGLGAEVFNVYDADSILQLSYDRASATFYTPDPRGRLQVIQRHIASPGYAAGMPPGSSISGTQVGTLPVWTLQHTYNLGDFVQYQGKPFRCEQSTCYAQTGSRTLRE